MASGPSPETKGQSAEPPAPEELKPQTAASDKTDSDASKSTSAPAKPVRTMRRGTYRPSHKATFVALAVVVLILAINAGIIAFVMKAQSKSKTQASQGQVTVSQNALDKLGVNRNSVGDAGVELVVNPNARFNNQVEIGGDTSIGGQLKLNGKFSASDAAFTQLEAGKTSISELDVNGNGTLSTLTLRNDLAVAGATRLQGPVNLSQLLTVENNVNIAGSVAIGGTLSVNTFHATNLVSDSTVTIGGHIITRGSAPSALAGSALGNNGTISISGNDASGTVAANIGTGAVGGVIANVTFRTPYSSIPHVVVTAVGAGIGSVYVNRSATGFSIGVNGSIPPGGYAFDYIVEQ